jgi:hypothetical protein
VAEKLPERSYGCAMGDGNPYDFIVVLVQDGTTQFLCTPCFVRTAADMLEAMTNPDNAEVQRRLGEVGDVDVAPMTQDFVMGRGHNAPAGNEDPDAIEAFAGFVIEEELPDAMRR